METQNRHFSISIIYWVTQVVFWLFVAAAILGTGIALGILFNLIGDDLNLRVGLPAAFDITQQGTLHVFNQDYAVTFGEAYGKIGFSEIPAVLGKTYAVFMIVVMGIFFFILNFFRKFTGNVYRGVIFETHNIMLLKKISYGLVIFWVVVLVYSVFQNFFIAHNLLFEGIELSGNMQFHLEIVFVAIFLWMLSHIFLYGTRLREDNELTI